MKKFAFVLGLMIGYVFGTRAGRERYEQIKRATLTLWDSNMVKRGRASVGEYTSGNRSSLQDSVVDAARNLVQAVLQFTKQSASEPESSTPAQKPARSTSSTPTPKTPRPTAEPKAGAQG